MCQLDKLHRLKAEIYQIAKKHNAEKVYVFGSCARKEETPESDVDFLMDFNEEASLFDQVGLQLDLADILNCKVDVLPLSSLADPDFGPMARKDMIPL
ncbi:MAG: nucleotidyltransferase domain-containing protein [Victivallales bacterium]|nr:nucleotidyltransferase domain-containing protein [Victivallales bacterium]